MYVPINCNRQQHIQQSSTLNGYIYIQIIEEGSVLLYLNWWNGEHICLYHGG
jgi:hypothetical protein